MTTFIRWWSGLSGLAFIAAAAFMGSLAADYGHPSGSAALCWAVAAAGTLLVAFGLLFNPKDPTP